MAISPNLQAAVTRALTNSRRTQKATGKDVLSRNDVNRIVNAARDDGVSVDEVQLIVNQVGQALRDDKLELDTPRRRNQINKLFDKLATFQTVPVDTEGHVRPKGSVSWIDALIAQRSGLDLTPPAPNATKGITLRGGAAAYERVANILSNSRVKPATPGPSLVSLELALETAQPNQREAVKAFYEDLLATGQPLTRTNIFEVLETHLGALQQADVDGSLSLSVAELESLDKVGDLAADLARALADREPDPAAAAHVFAGLSGAELEGKIRQVAGSHTELSYSYARTILFSELYNDDGKVDGFYTDRIITTTGTPRNMDVQRMNTEHSFPKSLGVKDLAALSDLHHLFPTDAETNAKRGNHPFGVVIGSIVFSKDDSKLGRDKNGSLVFEPPDEAKGAIARALMYIATVYELDLAGVGGAALMQQWNAEQPPTPEEVARNAAISKHQGNRNPFVDLPELVDRVLATTN